MKILDSISDFVCDVFDNIRIARGNGVWYFISKTDKRWNCSGKDFVGGFQMSPKAEIQLNVLKAKYGEPPVDLEFGYMKD